MSLHAFLSSMNTMTATQVITGWTALVQESLPTAVRPIVEPVSVRLGAVFQRHNDLIVSRLFQNPSNQRALLAGYQALESFVLVYGQGHIEFEPLFEGLATAIRSELMELLKSGQLQTVEDEMPDEAMVNRYETVLNKFLPKRYRRIVGEVGKIKGAKAIRSAIIAIERNIDQAPLKDVEGMLMFLKEFTPDGAAVQLGFDCLIRSHPEGLEREFTRLQLRIVQKLLKESDQVTYESNSAFRFLYENSVIKKFEKYHTTDRTLISVSKTEVVTPEYNEYAKPIMIATLKDTERALDEKLAEMREVATP